LFNKTTDSSSFIVHFQLNWVELFLTFRIWYFKVMALAILSRNQILKCTSSVLEFIVILSAI